VELFAAPRNGGSEQNSGESAPVLGPTMPSARQKHERQAVISSATR
jgi:hypothetical protein